ncbi:MAG: hypothetical protein HY902_08380 [Deltaproteobacteria bacterium]|nr:hypothetical protein [Deltaproteobacteria bacterium]
MARTLEDFENYVISSEIPSEQAGPSTWVLHDLAWGGAQIVVHVSDPLVVFRVKLAEVPAGLSDSKRAALYGRLLQFNATDMLQGAYALEGSSVVAVEVMQLENLDHNEFLAAIDSLSQAITDHRDELLGLLKD